MRPTTPGWGLLVPILGLVLALALPTATSPHQADSTHGGPHGAQQSGQHGGGMGAGTGRHAAAMHRCHSIQAGHVAVVTAAITQLDAKPQLAQLEGHLMRWLSVANRAAYAATHPGVSAYISTSPLSPRHPAWHKLLLAAVALQHSCAEYVWMLDSDAFIMNLSLSAASVIAAEIGQAKPKPDVLVARACIAKIFNSGSLFLRNSQWSQQHLANVWGITTLPECEFWWEQASLVHMHDSVPGVAEHYRFVPQRLINSYPPNATCGAHYELGDLALHFVADHKTNAFSLHGGWAGRIPVVAAARDRGPDSNGRESARPSSPRGRVFHVVQGVVRGQPSEQVWVEFKPPRENIRKYLESDGRLAETFSVLRPTPGDEDNPGWPVPVPLLLSRLAP